MEVPNSQLTTNFSPKSQLTGIFFEGVGGGGGNS